MKCISAAETGFDFDGVIGDTAEAFIRIACQDYGYCDFSAEDITNFELENCIAMPRGMVEKIFTEILLDSLGTGLRPMPGAIEGMDAICRSTPHAPITIITARPVEQPVYDWFEHHFPSHVCDRLQVIPTGDHDDKLRHIRACGLRYFIDDRAETCIRLAEDNIQPYVFSQPWNRGRHSLPTISNWDELVALLASPPGASSN